MRAITQEVNDAIEIPFPLCLSSLACRLRRVVTVGPNSASACPHAYPRRLLGQFSRDHDSDGTGCVSGPLHGVHHNDADRQRNQFHVANNLIVHYRSVRSRIGHNERQHVLRNRRVHRRLRSRDDDLDWALFWGRSLDESQGACQRMRRHASVSRRANKAIESRRCGRPSRLKPREGRGRRGHREVPRQQDRRRDGTRSGSALRG